MHSTQLPFDRCWWIDPGRVLGGPYPGDLDPTVAQRKRQSLADASVRLVVNLQELNERGQNNAPFADYRPALQALAVARGSPIQCQRLPIPDCGVPTMELMNQVMALLREARSNGQLAYVHCWGGHGRTGTVAGCWLVETGLSPTAALELIRQHRQHDRYLASQPSPQTEDQQRFIVSWHQKREERPGFRSSAP